MISSISGGSYLSTQMFQSTTQTESPFDEIDVNGDGSLDEDELGTFVSKVSENTGQSISVYDMISELDTDGDGLLSQDEFESGRPEGPPPGGMGSLFGKIDSNEDGSLDEAELSAFVETMSETTGGSMTAEELLSELDTDGNGLLNQEEFDAGRPEGPPPGGMGSLFGKIDSNEDGSLDEAELSAFVETMSKTTGGSLTAEELISELDTDGNGLLSEEEFDAGRPKGPPPGGMAGISGSEEEDDESSSGYIDPLDTNEDGVVDAQEAAAGKNMMAQEYMNQMSGMFEAQAGSQSLVNYSA